MKKIILTFLAGGLSLLVISSCHKDNNSRTINFQNIVGTYKMTAAFVSQGNVQTNILDSFPICQRDDLIEFNKDSSFKYVDAGLACIPEGSFSSTWSLTGNSLLILTTGTPVTVQSLSGTAMVWVYKYSVFVETLTYTRQ